MHFVLRELKYAKAESFPSRYSLRSALPKWSDFSQIASALFHPTQHNAGFDVGRLALGIGSIDPHCSVTSKLSPSWRTIGPLFYDGSHVPCHDDKRPNPQRASVWEIHPVYSVDVCKQKGKTCQTWISLDEWNGVESGEEDE